MGQAFVGFLPWIIFWVCSGFGMWGVALVGSALAAAALVGWRSARGQSPKTMELITLAYFCVHAVVTLVLGLPFLKEHGAVVNNSVLALMAWGSLAAGSPFTYEYARDSWDKALWNNPLFRAINSRITAVWGGIFAGSAALALAGELLPSGYQLLTNTIIPMVGLVAGLVFSSRYPAIATRRSLQRRLDAQNPYPWPAPSFAPSAPEGQADVAVIGAGLGGLSAAALLAKRGLRVVVYEHHFLAGGYCTSWERGVRRGDERLRYVFDAGVHDVSGLGERGSVRSLLRMLDIEERLEWARNSQEYFLGDLHLKIPDDAGEFAKLLGQHFPAEAENITRFFGEMELVYREMYADIEKTGGVPGDPTTVDDMLDYPKTHPHAYRWMERPFSEMLDAFFSDARLKRVFSALTGYLSDDEGALKVRHMAPIFGYYFDGGFYPVGGSQQLADALVEVIEQHGGSVRLRTPVRRVLVEGGRATGVELADGTVERATAVISNADVQKTFGELVGSEHLPQAFAERIAALRPSTSAFMVFLGVDMVPEIASITMTQGVGIMVPSKIDPSLAPAGHAAVTLIRLLPQEEVERWERSEAGYSQRKRAFADELIARAEQAIPGLSQHIVYRQEGSPSTFMRYAWASGGSIYGPAEGQGRMTVTTPVERLYLAGSGVMGGGVEAAVIAGVMAANAILPAQAARAAQPLAREVGAA